MTEWPMLKRTKFTPEVGRHYVDQRRMSRYVCLYVDSDGTAVLQNVASKWTFVAHGCGMYEDGSIDWDYSTQGRFVKEHVYD